MILAYEAIDADGKSTTDTVEAGDARQAGELLRARGLYVTHIAEKKHAGAQKAANVKAAETARLPLNTLVLFTRQMAMLLRAGSGVVPAVMAIKRQMRKPQQVALLGQVVADIE